MIQPRALLLIAVLGMALNCGIASLNTGSWHVDFNQFWAAGQLAGTGQIYDAGRLAEIERRLPPYKTVPFGRLPAFAAAFKVFTWMPYPAARLLWAAVNLAALGAVVLLWPGLNRAVLALLVAWSMPAWMLLAFGQDTGLYLGLVALGVFLLDRKRPFASGLVLALCASKFHLAVAIPVLLLARKEWRALAGGIAGGAVIAAVSFWVEGAGWPARLLAFSAAPEFSPAPDRMPNLTGLFRVLPHGALAAELAVSAALLAAVWICARRQPLGIAAIATVLAGMAAGHHSYIYDIVLLIPAIGLVLERTSPPPLRLWALFLASPLALICLLTPAPYPAQVLIVGFCLVVVGYFTFYNDEFARKPS